MKSGIETIGACAGLHPGKVVFAALDAIDDPALHRNTLLRKLARRLRATIQEPSSIMKAGERGLTK
jgi:hypothetical protein